MVGKDLIDLKDVDGKEFVRERVALGKSKPSFWQDYKFTNPVSKKIEPKSITASGSTTPWSAAASTSTEQCPGGDAGHLGPRRRA